jgi:methionine-rich copper-binding protein CopC
VAGHRRPIAVVTLGAAVALGAVLGFATPAQAHDALVSSNPGQGDVLTTLPSEFAITMNQPLIDNVGDGTGFGIQVTDAAGRFYGDGCLSLVDATLSMPATLGAAGQYTLVWQIVSQDSHPVSSNDPGYGPVTFTWQPPADAVLSNGSATAPVCGESSDDPEPQMTTQAEEPQDEPSAAPTAEADAPADTTSTLLWLGGAAVAVVAAIAATLLLVRPKKREGDE